MTAIKKAIDRQLLYGGPKDSRGRPMAEECASCREPRKYRRACADCLRACCLECLSTGDICPECAESREDREMEKRP